MHYRAKCPNFAEGWGKALDQLAAIADRLE